MRGTQKAVRGMQGVIKAYFFLISESTVVTIVNYL